MPMRMDIGFFILGVVLLVLALTGGRFKPLVLNLSKTIRSDVRLAVALLGIVFLFVALSFTDKRGRDGSAEPLAERPPIAAPDAPETPAPRSVIVDTSRPPARDPPGFACSRDMPVTASMITNHATGTNRKFVDATDMVGAGPASYAILHELPDGAQALNTTIRVPPRAAEFRVTVGYKRTALCTGGPDTIPPMDVAVMGDRSELHRSAGIKYKVQPIAVFVTGTSEITLATTTKAETNRLCGSVVWSEPTFVVRLAGERCK